MRYLELSSLDAIDPRKFRDRKPYPHANVEGLITPAGYEELRKNMPGLDLFEHKFGYERKGGQQPHDRYSLEYKNQPEIPQPWRDFNNAVNAAAHAKRSVSK